MWGAEKARWRQERWAWDRQGQRHRDCEKRYAKGERVETEGKINGPPSREEQKTGTLCFPHRISVGQDSRHSLWAVNINQGLGRCLGGSSSCQPEFGSQNSHKQPVTGEHSYNPNTRRQREQVSGLSCTPR